MQLTLPQIKLLENQQCSSNDWSLISVPIDFNPSRYHNVKFYGNVVLGKTSTEKEHKILGVIKSGIYNAIIENCHIGNEVYISNISTPIKNFQIEDACIISNCFSISSSLSSSCGIGDEIMLLDELGTKRIQISSYLNSSLAFLLSLSTHPIINTSYNSLINQEKELLVGAKKRIGKYTEILNCGILDNLSIGESCKIISVSQLNNGTIDDNVYIEAVTSIKNFYIGKFSEIDNAIISSSFIGEGVKLSEGIVIEHSAIFNNSTLSKGEVTASLLGPHSVSMHRSSLLIAGVFSYFNAGSGTNQSNHQYKLGPIHYGITERGVKMASNSYISWPAHIGAFSTITGRVLSHPYIDIFPFSLIIGNEQTTILKPAHTLSKGAIWRDCDKWKNRERRKSTKRKDFQNISPFDPHLIYKTYSAYKTLSANSSEDLEQKYKISISKKDKSKGLEYYKLYLNFFVLLICKKYGDLTKYKDKIERFYPNENDFYTVDLLGYTLSSFAIKKVEEEIVNNSFCITELLEKMQKEEEDILSIFLAIKIQENITLDSSITIEILSNRIRELINKDIEQDINLRKEIDSHIEKKNSTDCIEIFLDKKEKYKHLPLDII